MQRAWLYRKMTVVRDEIRRWKQTTAEVFMPLAHPPGEAYVADCSSGLQVIEVSTIVSDIVRIDPTTFRIEPVGDFPDGQYDVAIRPWVADSDGSTIDQDRDGIGGEPDDDRYTFTVFLDTTRPGPVAGFAISDDTGAASDDHITTDLDLTVSWSEPDDLSGIAGYLFDPAADLPSGDATPGGDAVFYVASLHGDVSGDLLVGDADLNRVLSRFGEENVGDIDHNGVVEQADLDLLLANMGSVIAADVTSDGVVDQADVAFIIANFGAGGDGDFDGDGTVGDADLSVVLSALGQVNVGDVNHDGVVNETDRDLTAANMGNVIPEDVTRDGVVADADIALVQSNFGATLDPLPVSLEPLQAPFGPVENPATTSGDSLLAMSIGPALYDATKAPFATRSLHRDNRLFVGPLLPRQANESRPLIRPARSSQAFNRIDETGMIAMRRAHVDATFARMATSRSRTSRARFWFLDDSLMDDDLSLRNARHRSTDVDQALEDELIWDLL
ncbi:MAG: hypothetical protein V3R99_13975, partial [Thermoguttaceae bacterium]